MMKSYQKLLGKEVWNHTCLILTNSESLDDPDADHYERVLFNAKALAEEICEVSGGTKIPVFHTSKKWKSSHPELKKFETFLEKKETVFTTTFFSEIRMAFQAGGIPQASEHVKNTVLKYLPGIIDNIKQWMKITFVM